MNISGAHSLGASASGFNSSGFCWGMKPTAPAPLPVEASPPWPKTQSERPKPQKRSHEEDSSSPPPQRRISTHKKSRTESIRGQALPLHRLIEVMTKEELQRTMMQMVYNRPELAQDVAAVAPKPSIHDALAIISTKLTTILTNLPYKVDPSSNYAFLRIKPSLDDFYEALSDYTLSYLPPVEVNHMVTLEFLDGITSFLHKLPNWTNPEFNHSKLLAYDQVAATWLTTVRSFIEHGSANLTFLLNNNYEAKVTKHNEASEGKFAAVWEYLRNEVALVSHATIRGSQNFSHGNSPLHGVGGNACAEDRLS